MIKVDKSTLYIVATPIGNLHDITYRAVEVLKNVDVILAEDTRVTLKLLNALDISNDQKILSCHDFNEESRIEQVVGYLATGLSVALVSDAGTPLISDPGYKLVSNLRNRGCNIVPIPGVSAIITALSSAGLPSDSFMFRGFLSAKKSKRQEQVLEIKKVQTTVILYESVHRLEYLLNDLYEIMPGYNIVVAKELTKQFERFVSGSTEEVRSFFIKNKDIVKGEFVIIIDCNQQQDKEEPVSLSEEHLLKELLKEMPLKKAVRLVTDVLKLKKNDVYQKALDLKKDME